MGLKAVPTTVYFVSIQQVTPQSTLTGEQLWQRNIQWVLSQWERSNPAYFVPQLRNGS